MNQEAERTPKRLNLKQDESSTRDTSTKSGRKVRRPAHLESPERTPANEGRKSILHRTKNVDEEVGTETSGTPGPGVVESTPGNGKNSRKTLSVARGSTAAAKQATPKRNVPEEEKLVEEPAGVSKSGRKIKVPAKLMEYESEVLSSPRKTSVTEHEQEGTVAAAPTRKTPGRPKSTVKQESQASDVGNVTPTKELVTAKTPLRRAKSVAASSTASDDVLDQEVKVAPVTTRTPGRRAGKSLLNKETASSSVEDSAPERAVPKTPGRKAGKAPLTNVPMDTATIQRSVSELAASKTPGRKTVKSVMEVDATTSRTESPARGDLVAKTPGRRATTVAKSRLTSHGSADDMQVTVAKNVDKRETKTVLDAVRTPGRRAAKSMLHSEDDPSQLNSLSQAKTPGRRTAKSMLHSEDDPSHSNSPALAKTPGRRRVVGDAMKMTTQESEESSKDVAKLDHTPARGPKKSLMNVAGTETATKAGKDSPSVPQPVASDEPISRSGRKIKPKKIFGSEQEESSNKPNASKEHESSTSGGRKQKVDDDEVITSPRKEKIVASPKERNETPKPMRVGNLVGESTETRSPSKPSDGEADVSVSRSGRKIKPKKMFGFVDGEEIDRTLVLGSSPVSVDASEKGKLATPTKKGPTATTPVAKKDVAGTNSAAKHSFITKRGVDDHHQAGQSVPGSPPIDEPDRALPMKEDSQPVIIRTSIGFGRPSAQKKPPTVEMKDDAKTLKDKMAGILVDLPKTPVENVTPNRKQQETLGNDSFGASSRSGRKIKPKKFFDADEPTTHHSPAVKEVKSGVESHISEEETVEHPTDPLEVKESAHAMEVEQSADTSGDAMVSKITYEYVRNPADDEPFEGIDVAEGPVKLETEMNVFQQPQPLGTGLSDRDEEQDTEESEPRSTSSGDDRGEPKEKDSIGTVEDEIKPHAPEVDDVARLQSNERTETAVGVEEFVGIDTVDGFIPNNAQNDSFGSSSEANVKHDIVGSETVEPTPCDSAGSHGRNDSVEKRPASPVEKDPEAESHNVSSESTIPPLRITDPDVVEEASFESVEYLEDEASNVAEHIRKPAADSSDGPGAEEDRKVPAIIVIPETPVAGVALKLNETYSPVKSNPSPSPPKPSNVTIIDITADTPRPTAAAAAPQTPDSKSGAGKDDERSPDKPPEVIEVLDSPMVAMGFTKSVFQRTATTGDGSATSTPLATKPLDDGAFEPVDVPKEGRKRSLSTSAVDTTMKRNVTFHSPANSTVLVDTIDERLMRKGLQQQQHREKDALDVSRHTGGKSPRKRTLSEYKSTDGPKPSKIGRLPDFKSIHANHFNRMESIGDFMRRKERRAKDILTSASPAKKHFSRIADALEQSRPNEATPSEKKVQASSSKPFIFKSAGGGVPFPSSGLFTAVAKKPPTGKPVDPSGRPVLSASMAPGAARKPIPGTNKPVARRLKHVPGAFKAKPGTTDGTVMAQSGPNGPARVNPAEARPVEHLRTAQSKILKGVRTNRRFELQMKHRDNLQQQ